jgi:lysine 2,3-aminomutase
MEQQLSLATGQCVAPAQEQPPPCEHTPDERTPLSGRARFFPNVSDAEWNDWRWQYRHRITTLEELARHLHIPADEWGLRAEVLRDFRMGITPYYLALIDPRDPDDPILRQVVPLKDEYTYRALGEEDPLGEENYSPVPGITHRYPDRVLMVVTNACAIYCRYCTRKRIMYEDAVPEVEVDRMVDYIARTPSVRDVVVSGGDPLTFSTAKLESILAKLRAIPHLEIIRIGSRVPVSLPQRIDAELCEMLQKYHPLWINVHFNLAEECTPDAAAACDRLIRAGIPLNNQAVLLKGVNDSLDAIRSLVHALMKMRVRPYYLYQCDPVRGAEHFRTPISKGLEIIDGLRGHTSGLAIPTFVIDAPGGGGKIPINPEYLLWYQPKQRRAILRNFQGRIFDYREPLAKPAKVKPSVSEAAARTPPASNARASLDAAAVGRRGATHTSAVAKGSGSNGSSSNGNASNGGASIGSVSNGNGSSGDGAKGNGATSNGAHAAGAPHVKSLNGHAHPSGNGSASHGGHAGNGHASSGEAPPLRPVVGKSRWARKGRGAARAAASGTKSGAASDKPAGAS